MAKNNNKKKNDDVRSKLAAARQANNNKKKKKGGMREYFKGVRLEMKKVTWPTKKELGSYTIIVIGTCVVFSLAFWAIDSGFLLVLKKLLGISM